MQMTLIGLLALLLTTSCGYKTLKEKEEVTTKAWSDISFSCRQRLDLSAAYMDTIKRYISPQSEVLIKAERAIRNARLEGCPRTPPETSGNVQRFREVQAELTQALAQLQLATSNHSELLKDASFLTLHKRMDSLETRLNESIISYNASSHDFNVSKKCFPNSLTNALLLRYSDRKLFLGFEKVHLSNQLDS